MRPVHAVATLVVLLLVGLPAAPVARAQAVARAQPTVAPPNLGSADSASTGIYEKDAVEKPARWNRRGPNDAPDLPGTLRMNVSAAGETVIVTTEFVVDSMGHADLTTFKLLASPDPALTASVKAYLARRARYDPAETSDGHRVPQLVHQDFVFKVTPTTWGLH